MEVSVTRHLLSLSDYHRMIETGILTENDRVEFIHGEIIEMSPIGSKHAAAVDCISNIMKEGKRRYCESAKPGNYSEP